MRHSATTANRFRNNDATDLPRARDAPDWAIFVSLKCQGKGLKCLVDPGQLDRGEDALPKKCDELRPQCGDCRRLGISCVWKSPSPSLSSDDSPSSHVNDVASTPLPSADLPTLPSPAFLDDESSLLIDPSWPILDFAIPSPGAFPVQIPLNPHLQTDEDISLFNHYVHIVSRSLLRSAKSDENPFLRTLLPVAATSDMVTSVILGLSGSHWKRVYPAIWGRALSRQGRALNQVNLLLSQTNLSRSLETCIAVLLLCLADLFEGTSRAWKWHLKAASALLRSLGELVLENTTEGMFCLQLFHYLDSMSTISRCRPPLRGSPSLYDLANCDDLVTSATSDSISFPVSSSSTVISGVDPMLLNFIGMVNLLASHRKNRVDELSEIGFRAAATRVQRQLDSWRREYQEQNPDSHALDDEMHQATTAFAWAIHLRLHQIVEGYDLDHPNVKLAIANIMEAMLPIPYGSPVEGSLLFPLVIAGAGSTDIEGQMVVKERLMAMEGTLGFGHVKQARQLLETVWAQGRERNWAFIRFTQFPGFVFV
ncbi:Zn(II)2Cys6 transcription factor [Aspergillus mulundensis]|uniref:Putative Permease of the major facilitator superfamily n=1 Tax=Aspergillus mulundensis TaxID=1810919 RepID=A0A3D8RFM0_9EURO|nr:putative Permease of the major facilitator superfamily [Aspergillus mulundensis]RDW72760.1 putative Permease of the major facilitator superfamily [Aspergillus mulundensis]